MSKVKNILISQPTPVELEKSPYGEIIRKYNVHIDFYKFFKIEGIGTREFRDEKIYINEFSAVIFNSKHAVDHFFRLAKEVRVDVPETMKYFCMSESIAYYLQKYVTFRKRKIFFTEQDMNQLVELMKKHKGETFLLPCSEDHNREIPDALEQLELPYREAIMYKTLPAEMKDQVNIEKYDMMVFFSPKGIQSLFYNWPDFKQGEKIIGTFGANTTAIAKEHGIDVQIAAPNANAPSMAMAIDQYLAKCNKK